MIYTRYGLVELRANGPFYLHWKLIRIRGGWEVWKRRRNGQWWLYKRYRPHPWEVLQDGETCEELDSDIDDFERNYVNWAARQ